MLWLKRTRKSKVEWTRKADIRMAEFLAEHEACSYLLQTEKSGAFDSSAFQQRGPCFLCPQYSVGKHPARSWHTPMAELRALLKRSPSHPPHPQNNTTTVSKDTEHKHTYTEARTHERTHARTHARTHTTVFKPSWNTVTFQLLNRAVIWISFRNHYQSFVSHNFTQLRSNIKVLTSFLNKQLPWTIVWASLTVVWVILP